MFCGYSQNVYLCGVVKMLPPRQRYKKGARLANFKTTEMEKTITVRTADRHLAGLIKYEIEAIIEDHVNCTWHEGAWEVSAEGKSWDIDMIASDYRECDNYREGLFAIELTEE